MFYKLITSSIVCLISFGSGVWLSRLGKPYRTLIFTIHKVAALAFIVYWFLIVKNVFKTVNSQPFIWLFAILAVFSVLFIMVSGGILSLNKEVKDWVVIFHKFSSVVLFISITGWFFLVLQ